MSMPKCWRGSEPANELSGAGSRQSFRRSRSTGETSAAAGTKTHPPLRAFESSLSKLGLDQLDLYLIHWPAPEPRLYEETWLMLIELQREGLVRSIGVSNFEPGHLDRLAEVSDVVAVNQIELQPFLQQARLRAYHREYGIVTESWSHLAEVEVEVLFPVIAEIAERHNVNAARVLLAWNLQLGPSPCRGRRRPSESAGTSRRCRCGLRDEPTRPGDD